MNRRYCNGMVHVIKPGDTLYQLSRYYRIPMAMLLRANPYVDVYNLQVGQEICIPMVRAHRGMICMPVPKDEPLPVTAVVDETETETQVQSQEESSAKVSESENAENEPEKVAEEPAETSEEKEVVSSASAPSEEEEKKVYITDGKQSLGEVLMAHETTWEEFVRLNNLDQVALQEDQILYFAK